MKDKYFLLFSIANVVWGSGPLRQYESSSDWRVSGAITLTSGFQRGAIAILIVSKGEILVQGLGRHTLQVGIKRRKRLGMVRCRWRGHSPSPASD